MQKITVSIHIQERDTRRRLLVLHHEQDRSADVAVPYDQIVTLPCALFAMIYLQPAEANVLGFDPSEILTKDQREVCERESARLGELVQRQFAEKG